MYNRRVMIKRLVKKLFPSRPGPADEGRGPVLEDGLPVWAGERGDSYGGFWSSAAQSWKGACLVTRNADVDRDEMHRQCEYVARNMIRALKLNRESVVLEVGCGMGAMAYFIAPEVKEYHGADISSSMIEQAPRRSYKRLDNENLGSLDHDFRHRSLGNAPKYHSHFRERWQSNLHQTSKHEHSQHLLTNSYKHFHCK